MSGWRSLRWRGLDLPRQGKSRKRRRRRRTTLGGQRSLRSRVGSRRQSLQGPDLQSSSLEIALRLAERHYKKTIYNLGATTMRRTSRHPSRGDERT